MLEPPAESGVADWATDFDHTDEAYADAAPEIWADLRDRCPVAHTDRFGGAWLPTRHDDVSMIAHGTHHCISVGVIVSRFRPGIPARTASHPDRSTRAKRPVLQDFRELSTFVGQT